jgi:hypothetical protein
LQPDWERIEQSTEDESMSKVNSPTELLLLSEAQKRSDIIMEYLHLAVLETLTEPQADRMEQILENAESDSILAFLIDEADHIIGHELDLIDSDRIAAQQETLQQKLDKTWVQLIISRSRLDRYAQLPKETLEDAQQQLQKRGLYDGPIDGQCGEETKAAFRKLETLFHEEWGTTDPAMLTNCEVSPEGLTATKSVASLSNEDIAELYSKAQLLILQTWLSTHS